MRNEDWTLRYPGTELVFGSMASGFPLKEFPETGSIGAEYDDEARPRQDGMSFGQDFETDMPLTFRVWADGYTVEEGMALAESFLARWRPRRLRHTPGAVAELESFTGRFVYGRPRRSLFNDDRLKRDGIVDMIVEFDAVDPHWYGPGDQATLQYVPAASGGFTFPLVFPMTTSTPSDRSVAVKVGGSMETWPVTTIKGPIIAPQVVIGDFIDYRSQKTLSPNDTLVIDSRPWNRGIYLNGAGVGGFLDAYSTRLAQSALPPGNHEILLRGTSAEGTALVTVQWQNAYSRY